MGNHVKGKNIVLTLKVGSTYYPVFCAKTIELRREREAIEKTSINSGFDREFTPGMRTTRVTCSGVTVLDNTQSRIAITYLLQNDGSVFDLRLTMTDDDGDDLIASFQAIIPSQGFSRETAGYSTSDVEFLVSGVVTWDEIVTDPTPPACEVEDTLYKTLAEGATSVTDALLTVANVEILWVTRSGATYYYTSGTPGSLQYSQNLGTGTISFDPTNPGNAGGEPVSIGYKIGV